MTIRETGIRPWIRLSSRFRPIDFERSVEDVATSVRTMWADTEENRAYFADLQKGKEDVSRRRLCAVELLGTVLKEYNLDPATLSLARTAQGKPYLVGVDKVWDFSLSHTQSYVVCGVIKGGRIGVDAEECASVPEERACRMAKRFFSEEERREMQKYNDPVWGFLQIWTLREALCKLDGKGNPLRVDAACLPLSVRQRRFALPGGGCWTVVYKKRITYQYPKTAKILQKWRKKHGIFR